MDALCVYLFRCHCTYCALIASNDEYFEELDRLPFLYQWIHRFFVEFPNWGITEEKVGGSVDLEEWKVKHLFPEVIEHYKRDTPHGEFLFSSREWQSEVASQDAEGLPRS